MLIKFDKAPVTAKNGNQFVRGIVASGELAGGRCVVWSDEPEFDLLADEICQVEADVRDFVAVAGNDGVTRESWVLADVTVTTVLEGETRAAVRAEITAAQITALKGRGPRPIARKSESLAAAAAVAGVEADAEALLS